MGDKLPSFWALFDATTDLPYLKKMIPENVLAIFDNESDVKAAKLSNSGTDYKAVYITSCAKYDALRAENLGMVAQRMAYASEFPLGKDGLPDTGSIHQNIRKLRAENAELKRDADRWRFYREGYSNPAEAEANVDAAMEAATQPSDKP